MSGRRVELAPGGRELKISFPYDERLLPVVRAIPGRRFDRASRAWFCPGDEVLGVVDRLWDHHFVVAADVLDLYHGRGGQRGAEGRDSAQEDHGTPDRGPTLFDALSGSDESPAIGETEIVVDPEADWQPRPLPANDHRGESSTTESQPAWTISQLNRRVREALQRAFPQEIWLIGEISGFERSSHRKHVYFELVEKDTPERGGAVRATLSAVLFERTKLMVQRKLAAATESMQLQDGLEVRVLVRVELYEARGSYQVLIEDLDPFHTLSKIVQNREKVLAELQRRGLAERNRELAWPQVPLRVGLITSRGSDAYNDFLSELARSGLAFQVTVVHSTMQGKEMQYDLSRALLYFSRRAECFDAVALVRGGGSRTDLMWLDSLPVALAVARCPIKIVSGLGHHRDVSVLDMIAHREKTPTAAAAALVERAQRFADHLDSLAERVHLLVPVNLSHRKELLRRQAQWLLKGARSRVQLDAERLRSNRQQIRQAAAHAVQRARGWLRDRPQQLRSQLRTRAQVQRARLQSVVQRLAPEPMQRRLQTRQQQMQTWARMVDSLHPRAILRRGFAWVRDPQGATVRSVEQIDQGQGVEIELSDGKMQATVTDHHKTPSTKAAAKQQTTGEESS
jgi:exodeoxyribonuclease VII large subunit